MRISRAQIAQILEEARAAAPNECCGLLLGDPESGEIWALQPGANIAQNPSTHFELDPAILLAAHKAARTGGPALIGHYHSHPAGIPHPSQTDADMAEKRGEIWLILGMNGAMRAWRAEPRGAHLDSFTPLEIVDDDTL